MFEDGMQLPAGTTNNFASAVYDFFFQPLLNTVFQNEFITLMVVCAAVGLMVGIVGYILGSFLINRSVERKEYNSMLQMLDGESLGSMSGNGVSDARIAEAQLAKGMTLDQVMSDFHKRRG